jgi:hypothetical protein
MTAENVDIFRAGDLEDVAGGPIPTMTKNRNERLLRRRFTEAQVSALRTALATTVAAAGLSGDLAQDFVLAVHELVIDAVRHGGGAGQLEAGASAHPEIRTRDGHTTVAL